MAWHILKRNNFYRSMIIRRVERAGIIRIRLTCLEGYRCLHHLIGAGWEKVRTKIRTPLRHTLRNIEVICLPLLN